MNISGDFSGSCAKGGKNSPTIILENEEIYCVGLAQYDLCNQWPISSFLVVDYVPLARFTCGKVLEWLSNHLVGHLPGILVVHDGL